MPVHTFGEEERASGKRRGIVQPVPSQCLEKCIVAHLHDVGFKRAAQISYLLVTEVLQMRDRQFHSLLIVDPYIGDRGIVMNLIVVEHSGSPGRPKVLHPGIVQGESEDKRRGIIILQHEDIVGNLFLCLGVYRNDLNLEAGRFGHLPKAHYNVIGKVMGL